MTGESTAAVTNSRWQIWAFRLGWQRYRLAKWLGLPGAIRDMEVHDGVSGQHVQVRVGTAFTIISINGRDYYFNRFSGKFDGTGSGCASPMCRVIAPPRQQMRLI